MIFMAVIRVNLKQIQPWKAAVGHQRKLSSEYLTVITSSGPSEIRISFLILVT